MSLGINPPRYPALERAMVRWGIADPDPIEPSSALLTRLRQMQTLCNGQVVEAKPEPRFLTDRTYWREMAATQGLCLTCFGTGELPEHDGHGGMEYIPCPTCQRYEHSDQPYDDVPF